jgi:3-oxo-5,6-didehydrosuberyl-CoA/3-oxoadipyl-CoA thiolase
MTCSVGRWCGPARAVGIDLDRIEDMAAGFVNVAHEGMGDPARRAALAAAFPDSIPPATVASTERAR